MILKRINKELNDFKNSNYKYDAYLYQESDKYYININKIKYNNIKYNNLNNIILKLYIPNDYPFKPYHICYYEKPYNEKKDIYFNDSYLRFISKYNKKIPFYICFFMTVRFRNNKYKYLNNINCLCCNSVTCSSNWNPSIKIKNVIDEYKFSRILNFYCSTLMRRHLKTIFSYFDKLDEDVIDLILNYANN